MSLTRAAKGRQLNAKTYIFVLANIDFGPKSNILPFSALNNVFLQNSPSNKKMLISILLMIRMRKRNCDFFGNAISCTKYV
jgi:hypothetical protein